MFDGVRNIKSSMLFPVITDIINDGTAVRFSVTGMSMYPFLRENIDSVEVIKASFENLKRGDIVVIQREDGDYVMHRIISRDADRMFIIGDAQKDIEGPIYEHQLFALVSAVWRDNKKIEISNKKWIVLSELWLRLRPLRGIIMKAAGMVGNAFDRQKQG